MTQIQAIPFLDPATPLVDPSAAQALTATTFVGHTDGAPLTRGADFTALVNQGLDAVQTDWRDAQSSMRAVVEGQPVNLHQLMMRMEESRISFQLFLQVRNRLLESYQDVMRMQV